MISTVFSISSTSDFFANDVLKFSLRLSTIVIASPTPLKSFLSLEEVDYPVQGGDKLVYDHITLFFHEFTHEEFDEGCL